jgi:hypothetical protein
MIVPWVKRIRIRVFYSLEGGNEYGASRCLPIGGKRVTVGLGEVGKNSWFIYTFWVMTYGRVKV